MSNRFRLLKLIQLGYAVSDQVHTSYQAHSAVTYFIKTTPFPRRLRDYYCDEWKEAPELKIMETYLIGTTLHDNTLPQKEKDPGSFTLLCFIHNVCFDKTLVDLGVSVSVMPFSTYTNLGLGDLAHTRLTVELADRTIKHPRGIAENVLVRIGKIIFPIDFIILDIPEDDDVPLILGRPFLSTAHAKIDVYKRKFTLRDAIRRILGFGIQRIDSMYRPCCKEIDELVMVYSGKRCLLNSYGHSDASSTYFYSRTQIGESSRAKYQGIFSF
ncbi:hypothetical protein Tco_0472808 [Tanacetum coccineum]